MLIFENGMPAPVNVLFTAWVMAAEVFWLVEDTPGRLSVATTRDIATGAGAGAGTGAGA